MSHEPQRRSRPRAAIRCALITLLTGTLPAALALAPERFPYIPTTILTAAVANGEHRGSADSGSAYVFREKNGRVEFSSLDIGTSVNGDQGFKALSSELPFLKDSSDTTVFSPTLAETGDLVIYAGDCDSAEYGIWTYTPSDREPKWSRRSSSPSSSNTPVYPAPNFLGGSVSFSSQLEPSVSEPVLYSFGGMCANASDAWSWQGSGRYSNSMRKASLADPKPRLSSVPSKGPIAEAGFTLTRLVPSLSTRGDKVTQRSSYLMLGGHTQDAFINMSTAAVWNLPEETWSFVDVKNKDSEGAGELKSDLTARAQESIVDSRSGHTAVLSEDGNSLVLLGGWVGDVTRAAQPQLVVLKMGASYDEWEWAVPDGQPKGAGIYGHGAALLPGNVMMVHGGYEIEGSTWRFFKRQSFSDGPQFLDLESMEWSTTYTNPTRHDSSSGSDSTSGDNKSANDQDDTGSSGRAKRLGLGIGLGLGIPILIAAAAALFFCRRYTRRRRTMRDDAIAALAQDRALFLHSEHDMTEREFEGYDAFGPGQPTWYTGGHDPYDNGARSLGAETLRGGRPHGLGLSSAGMMQLPRKPVARPSRGSYQPAGSAAPSGIHPIAEADEEAEQIHEREMQVHAYANPDASNPPTPTSQPPCDPFATPPAPPALLPSSRSSATPSPERMDPDVHDWMTDVDAAEGLLSRRDRRSGPRATSPHKNGRAFLLDDETRTASNLSESARSAISTITRSTSGRSHFRAGFGLLPGGASADGRLGSSSSGSPSYGTAKSSFTVMQAEGPGLLQGTSAEVEHYDPPTQRDEQEEDDVPGSPSKMKPRRGWLGSLRRVFSNTTPGPDTAEESPTRSSFEHTSSDFEPRPHRLSSIGGGSLLRRKQGKYAWEDALPDARRDGAAKEAAPRHSGDTDWDIERAVEQRLVQVMFTVPREPLRVVNAEVEGDEVSVSGRKSPARSLMERDAGVKRLGDMTLPELRPVSALEDPFVERAPSAKSLYEHHLEDVDIETEAVVAPLSLPKRVSGTELSDLSMATDEETAVPISPLSTPSRRMTKVLEMVETIESKSRESSPKRRA